MALCVCTPAQMSLTQSGHAVKIGKETWWNIWDNLLHSIYIPVDLFQRADFLRTTYWWVRPLWTIWCYVGLHTREADQGHCSGRNGGRQGLPKRIDRSHSSLQKGRPTWEAHHRSSLRVVGQDSLKSMNITVAIINPSSAWSSVKCVLWSSLELFHQSTRVFDQGFQACWHPDLVMSPFTARSKHCHSDVYRRLYHAE